MMRLLFYATVFLSFSHLKDSVFLIDQWKNSMRLNDLVITIDLLFLPLICAFFLEATRPGAITKRHLLCALGVQSVFIPIFAVCPDGIVVFCAMAVAYSMSVVTIVYVLIFAAKYHRFIAANYSYTENIDVKWVTVSCVVYFFALFFYSIAFDETTWLSESLYNVFSILLWTFLFVFARRHRVMRHIMPKEKTVEASEDVKEEIEDEEESGGLCRDYIMDLRLRQFILENKMYLNPRLSLGDVAQAIGSNKTYLSDYFNNTLHTSFYDYINTFRIAEACRIIDAMPEEGRKSMVKVAEMSGFNSKSTFNRYFLKVKGMSPREYFFAGKS